MRGERRGLQRLLFARQSRHGNRTKFGKSIWTPETVGMMYLDMVIGLWKLIDKDNGKAADPSALTT